MKRFSFLLLCSILFTCLGCSQRTGPGSAVASPGLATLDFREVVKKAKDKVFPAVVFIKCVRETHETGKKISQEISGSGVIVSTTGEVLTNWHVVDKAVEVRCLLFDGQAMDAKVLGTDKDTDLALLQLRMPDKLKTVDGGEVDLDSLQLQMRLPYAQLGDSTVLREGDFVMAMGAPWGMSRSVSIGIVSCTHRFLPANHSQYSLWLQTDASICPGNSGGPLVNTAGDIIGINTLATYIGGDMGFAVPSDTIRHILPQLREHGKVNWSWYGLQLQPLRDFNKNIYFDATRGVIVAGTDPESPARHAGILAMDHIVKVNGESVDAVTEEDLPAMRRMLGLMPKHEPVKLELIRKNETVVVDVTPREKGEVEGNELDCPRWDFTVKTINQFDNPDLHFYRKEGIFVFGIKYPGNATSAGLRQQDIILKIDDKEVTTLEQVKEIHQAAIDNVNTKSKVMLSVMRNGLMRQFVIDFSRDYEKE